MPCRSLHRTALAALVAAIALTLAACAPAPLPGGATPDRAVLSSASPGARLAQARDSAGVPALRRDARLDAAAQRHADWIAATGAYGHAGAGGSRVSGRVDATGYCRRAVAENLAWGIPTADRAMAGWLASPGHRRNLIHPMFRAYGLGQAGGTWVLVLAQPC